MVLLCSYHSQPRVQAHHSREPRKAAGTYSAPLLARIRYVPFLSFVPVISITNVLWACLCEQRTLEAFIAILTLTQLLYLILLHTGSLGSSMTLGLSRRNCDDDEELRCDEIPREELYTNKKPAIVAGA